jgi:hypothetical protein
MLALGFDAMDSVPKMIGQASDWYKELKHDLKK